MRLCGKNGCRLLDGHSGKHSEFPESIWKSHFISDKDIDKINKAGYATPRGGNKGAYQNHVYRNNKVIIPYEKLDDVNIENYADGYVIRLRPDQYFSARYIINPEIIRRGDVFVGENAFVLYRNYEQYNQLPPLEGWMIRHMEKDGIEVKRRNKSAVDKGEYVLRLATIGGNPKRDEGIPQGIFAPEYSTEQTNFLAKAILAWLIIKTENSPYAEQDFLHLKQVLIESTILDTNSLAQNYILVDGITCCPLCQKKINYSELHEMVSFKGADALSNSQEQVEGSTRSTKVNLFHMAPLCYETLEHKPTQVAWGHAICNTVLGQRRCRSLSELMDIGQSVVLANGKRVWMSADLNFLRSEQGDVWVRISDSLVDDFD